MKEITISLNGKSYDVKVGDTSTSPVEVIVDGNSYQVEFEEAASSQTPVTHKTATPVAAPAVLVAAPVPAAATGNGVRAPMPGTIVSVDVKPGDKVTRGQQLVSLEAMKMKNSIKSPVDAVVKSVHVTNGQKVQFNDVIVAFE
jgi:glutaconyl-CoA/methylmalonyl-CoA decarboxylase subunit gamma